MFQMRSPDVLQQFKKDTGNDFYALIQDSSLMDTMNWDQYVERYGIHHACSSRTQRLEGENRTGVSEQQKCKNSQNTSGSTGGGSLTTFVHCTTKKSDQS